MGIGPVWQLIDAAIELIQAGNPAPTAPQITEQAGVSLRVIYNHFPMSRW